MKEKRFINSFAIFTISIALVHFVLETLYTIKFGQTWAGLLPDYIAVSLMWAGGIIALKNIKGVGILCGAWGFAFCLHYRSWAWRFDDVINGTATTLVENTMYVLVYTMPISTVSFINSLIICFPKTKEQ